MQETPATEETQRYQIGDRVGQGGLGSVHRAWDTRLGRWVAVKRLVLDANLPTEEIREKMRGEANALAALQHPNVVTVHDFGVDEQGPFVVMEFVDGQTLDAFVEGAPFDYASFLELARQTLAGVAAAHRAGLLHRDLKPGNLMLTAFFNGTFQVKVLDFGLAKFAAAPSTQTIDQANTLLGSIYFMAPEQFRREPLDRRTDLYALGCVFYHALTGRHPFAGESVAETMGCHLRHDVSDLALQRPDLPAPISAWVMGLLSLAPDDRPADALEALHGLNAATGSPAADPRTAAVPDHARRPQHRLLPWLGGLCLTVAALGLGGYAYWHRTHPAAPPRPAAPPSISLFASTPTAHAQGRVPGSFTIVRNGDQTAPVAVAYSIRGSAKNGVDYERIEATKTIPAGETSAKIMIVPKATSDRTREEGHVRLTLQPAGAYTVATPDEVKLKIVYDR